MERITRMTMLASFDRFHGDDAARAGVIREFVESLGRAPVNPQWAVEQAIDRWIDSHHRLPSPGELRTTLGHIVEPIQRELNRREHLAKAQAEFEEASKRDKPTPELAQAICDQAGFTPQRVADVIARPMASPAELEAGSANEVRPTRFCDRRHPDDVRISRLRDPVMRASMGLSKDQADAEITAILERRSQEDAA